MDDHPPDPKKVKGIPLVYTAYRSTPVGEALDTILEDLNANNIIPQKIQQKMLDKFDIAMTSNMNQMSQSDCVIEGNTVNFQFIYNYYHIFMKPAVITLGDKKITSGCLEILALCDEEKDK